ncbi:MAG: aminoacetone oxidase family FAD-binding enzyme [Clostridia bacterium]|nr:aminoacetone oxidase family FAD-binding enzyme [Clostridia bacterium]MDE7328542.1 aminoacetone oxidase family FAD-binding enzyme [Clostridia bacterium]
MSKKIFIIGGGASGILCALKLAEKGASVTLAERSDRIGKKLLASGNGKCNLSNLNLSASDYNSAFVASIIDRFPPQRIIEEFSSLGLLCKADGEGRVYPYSESATSLLNVLLQRLNERRVNILCDCFVEKITRNGNGFNISTTKGEFAADTVVLASGSDATSGCNSHSLVADFSHTVTPIRYAIAPLLSCDVKGANGVRAKVNAQMKIDGYIVMSEKGELLFKDGAISGILAFRLSSMLARRKQFKSCEVILDFVPDKSQEQLAQFIYDNCSAIAPLEGILHKALAYNVLSKIPMDRSLIMSQKKAYDIARACKNYTVKIDGVGGRSNAQVACGGIALDGIDPYSLQSIFCKGLYIIGEVCDVDGLCGGYNLHWAWASALACSEDIL